ncbi:MAG TPA: MaoC/PaaZ C-terminal domain-containing protein [Bacteroidia bacterium]|nr:MaoC/PaaZ C-terminal domain-containing protein [Bacteroidia bacterium]
MEKLFFKDFAIGKKFDFGVTSFTEDEIIAFAKLFDPLDFHIDREAAKKSYFRALIASGPHCFNFVHRTQWIPRFKDTVIAGMEVNHWKFIKPVYANMNVHSSATILDIKPNPENTFASVTWLYEFKNDAGELVQTLEMVILHKIS